MTRIPTGPIQVRPQNDMLTAILGVAIVVQLLILAVMVIRSYTIFDGLF